MQSVPSTSLRYSRKFYSFVVLRATVLTKLHSCSVLLQYMESTDPYDWKGIVLAVSMFLFNVTASILIHNFLFHAWTAGIRVRSVLNSIVYRKVSEKTVLLLSVLNFNEHFLNDFYCVLIYLLIDV